MSKESKSGAVSLEERLAALSPQAYYQSPGGRKFLVAAASLAGMPRDARVLDVQCGIGSASIDLAEAFGAAVTAFDDYAPYLAFGRQQASSRGVGKQVVFKPLTGVNAPAAFEPDSFDVVLGLGGGLSDTIPGGLAGGLGAAANWLTPGGFVVLGDLVAPGQPSDLMRIVFGETLLGEEAYFAALAEAGFTPIFAARSTSADWDEVEATMHRLQDKSLDLGPADERHRQQLTRAARNHPEIAYLNVVARKN